MSKKALFLWPHEPYLPTSLFKHYVYLGETAQHLRQYADVDLLDLSVSKTSRQTISEKCRDADFVIIPTEAYTFRAGVKLAELAKQAGDAKTINYGLVPCMNPSLAAVHFDYVISTGHWENALKQAVTAQAEFEKNLNGKVYAEADPLKPEEWPHPPLDLLPTREYLDISPGQLEISVQKGCVYRCTFCAENSLIPEKKAYHRDPDNTAKFLRDNADYQFYIDATTFTLDRTWVRNTCDAMVQSGVAPRWKTVTRIDALDEEIVARMAEAGCYKIGMGVETISSDLQVNIKKRIDPGNIIKAVALLRKYDITPRLFLILGLPEQTAKDVLNTQEFIKEVGAEYRWKEYVPLEEIPHLSNASQFEIFERNTYYFHQIPGLSRENYLRLLSTQR